MVNFSDYFVCKMFHLFIILSLYQPCVYRLFYHREFKMGGEIQDQQVSCLWQGSYLLSVSLSGYINYLDVNNPDKPLRIIKVCYSTRV